ncbi:DUF11 domain-containing protein [Flavobacterium sp. LPB0248]|uniref:DUF7507 domain-containing protein n=1 Tax=Flavobacterium sp. LPB0248 TaxID=2614441 RepID=UPI0015A72BCD|nr:gliding motility-associated C-terminal domain-containing protein [Flavobacterium sp. LPB0248]QLC66378.1 DUF11 domain-containing protein [Flavobacterium sp. LPB0248]
MKLKIIFALKLIVFVMLIGGTAFAETLNVTITDSSRSYEASINSGECRVINPFDFQVMQSLTIASSLGGSDWAIDGNFSGLPPFKAGIYESFVVPPSLPPLTISKELIGYPDGVRIGDLLTYHITITNPGNTDRQVNVRDYITSVLDKPFGISNGGIYTSANRNINWTNLTVLANNTLTLEYSILVPNTLPLTQTKINNTAYFTDPLDGKEIASNPVSVPVLSMGCVGNSQLLLTGSANDKNKDYIQLTAASGGLSGQAWSLSELSLENDFNINFNAFFGADPGGADGFAFIMKSLDAASTGLVGGGLGYGGIGSNGKGHSFIVEFDTFYNARVPDNATGELTDDTKEDHSTFQTSGDFTKKGRVGDEAYLGNIKDGKWHDVRIRWTAASHFLEVYYDGKLINSLTRDLVALDFAGNPLINYGYTSSTGGSNNEHAVCIKEVTTCKAGTTAPVVSTKAAQTICLDTTFDLNSLITSMTPSGTALVWYTDQYHRGEAYATPNQAVAGTYYAFYYDPADNCYSPGTAVVTLDTLPTITTTGTVPTCIGDTATMAATPAGGKWSSSNPTVLSIDSITGLATALTAGNADIIYTASSAGGGCTTTAKLPVTVTGCTKFTVVKTVADASGDKKAQANEELTYTITVKNTGSATIKTLTVSDAVPANTVYVSGGTLSGGKVSFTDVNLGVGASRSYSFVVKAASDLTGVDAVSNLATVSGDGGSDVPSAPEDPKNPGNPDPSCTSPAGCPTDIPTDDAPKFTVVKTVADASGDKKAQANEELTYTITVKNTGSATIKTLTVSDAVPANTVYVSGGTLTGSTVSFTAANLGVGGSTSFTFKVKAAADLTGVSIVSNLATVSGDGKDVPSAPEDPKNPGNPDPSCTSPAGCPTDIPTDDAPKFTVVKTVADANKNGKAEAGEELTYTITVKNTGSATIKTLTVSDAVPANTVYVSGGTLTGSTVSFTAANLGVGGSTSFTFKVKAAADLTGVSIVSNLATVSGDGKDVPSAPEDPKNPGNPDPSCTSPAGCPTDIPTDDAPKFTVVKTVADANKNGKAEAGEELTYTITVKNTGSATIKTLTVSDAVPANTVYVSGGTLTGSTVSFTAANLGVGGSTSFTFKVKAAADLTGVSVVSNLATVSGDGKDVPSAPEDPKNPGNPDPSCTSPAGCPTDIPTDGAPKFTVVKTVADANKNGKAEAGEELTYTITVKNTGSATIKTLTVSDAVPANTVYVSGGTLSGGKVSFTDVNLGVGASRSYSFVVKTASDLTGVDAVSNLATVSGDGKDVPSAPEDPKNPGNPDPSCTSPAGCPTDIPTDDAPKFTVVKTVADASGDKKAQANEELTYTITVKNTGSATIKTLTVSDAVPANTVYVSGGTLTGSTVSFTAANLGVGGSTSFTFKVKAAADLTGVSVVSNLATVSGDGKDVPSAPEDPKNPGNPDPSCTSPAGCPTDIPTDGAPKFTVVKTVADANKNGKAEAGEELTYTITVKNTGSATIKTLTVSDAVPANTVYVSGGTLSGGKVSFADVNLGVGASRSYSFVVKTASDLTGVDAVSNLATVSGDGKDVPSAPEDPNNPGNPDPSCTSPAGCPTDIPTDGAPKFTVVKTVADANKNGKAEAGEELTYTITVKNTGSTSIKTLTVSDAVPANTVYVSGGTLTGSTVSFTAANLGVGGSRSFTFKVKAAADLTGVSVVSNLATVKGDGGSDVPSTPEDPKNPGNPDPSCTSPAGCPTDIPTDDAPKFTVVKTVADANKNGKAEAGEELTYTITVKNTGSATIKTLTVSDAVPANTVYVSGGTLTGSTVSFTAANLGVGGSTSFTFKVKAAADLTGVSVVSNLATVSGDGKDVPSAPEDPKNPGNPDPSCTSPAGCPTDIPTDDAPKFTVVKTVADANNNGKAEAGEELTYTITVKNTGSATIKNLTVSDAVPANTVYVSGGTLSGGKVSFTDVNLGVGASRSYSFVVKTASDLTGVDAVSNLATVSGDGGSDVPSAPEDPNNPGNPDPSCTSPAGCPTDIPTDDAPKFTVVKTVADANNNGKAEAGEELTYTITVKNTGSATIKNLTVSDAVPANTVYVSGGTLSGGKVSFTDVNLGVGASRSYSFVVKTASDLTGVDAVSNLATVSGDGGSDVPSAPEDPNNPGNPDPSCTSPAGCPTDIPTDDAPKFTVVKTVADANKNGKAEAGEELTYTITVKNTGSATIKTLTVSDAVPANTIYVSGGTLSGGKVSFTDVNLGVGASRSYSFVVKTASDLTGVDAVSNLATVSGDGGSDVPSAPEDPNNPGNPDPSCTSPAGCPTDIPTDDAPKFTVVKTVADANKNGKAEAGEELTYTITVKNTGSATIKTLTVSDAVPANTIYVSGGTLSEGKVSFTDVNLGVGASRSYSFVVKTASDLTGVDAVSNLATVKGDGGSDVPSTPEDPNNPGNPDPSCTSPAGCPTDIPTDDAPKFTVVKTVADANKNGKAEAGEELTYTITVKNTGSATIKTLTVSDAVPANTIYVSGGTLSGGKVSFTDVNLGVGASRSYSFVVKTASDLTGVDAVSNLATVKGDGGSDVPSTPEDPNNPGNPDPSCTSPAGCPTDIPTDDAPKFTVVKTVADASGDKKAQANEELTYTITVKNTGSATIKNLTVSDAVPANTVYVSGGTLSEGKVSFTDVNLGVGASRSYSFIVKVAADLTNVDKISNLATVKGDGGTDVPSAPEDPNNPGSPDPSCIGGCSTDIPTHAVSSIAVIKKAVFVDENNNGYAEVGETIRYSFEVKNTGNETLTNVTITDNLPGLVLSGSPITLAPGEINSTNFVGVYAITKADIDAGSVTNQALAEGTTPSGEKVNALSDNTNFVDDKPTVIDVVTCVVEVFNAVSPNGDGINDEFRIQGLECYPNNTVEIYNRWGVKVFETSGYGSNGNTFKGYSDGRATISRGESLPDGTYFYILKYFDEVRHKMLDKSGYLYIKK